MGLTPDFEPGAVGASSAGGAGLSEPGTGAITGHFRNDHRGITRQPALKGSRCRTTISCSFKPSRHTTMPYGQLVQARVDREVREEAAAVLATMGLTVSDAVRLLLTRVAREKALPFAPLVPNAPTIAAMKEARAGNLPQFEDVQSLLDDLHADD